MSPQSLNTFTTGKFKIRVHNNFVTLIFLHTVEQSLPHWILDIVTMTTDWLGTDLVSRNNFSPPCFTNITKLFISRTNKKTHTIHQGKFIYLLSRISKTKFFIISPFYHWNCTISHHDQLWTHHCYIMNTSPSGFNEFLEY